MARAWQRWLAISGLGHVALGALAAVTLPLRTPERAVETVTVDFVPAAGGPAANAASPSEAGIARVPHTAPPPAPEPAALGRAHNAQNVNTRSAGARGDGRSLESGRLLTERPEAVTLSPHLMNSLSADQEHRLRTARDRVSPQDVRATPAPGYDPWIASTGGILLFRLRSSTVSPLRGARVAPGVAVGAGAAPAPPQRSGEGPGAQRMLAVGSVPRPAAGIAAPSHGRAPRAAGQAANGRASIEAGHASTTADLAAERPRDDMDAEALATTLARNALATSVQSGPEHERGVGGVGGGGAPGSGGAAANGGHAQAFGEERGWLSLSAPDARYFRYFQEIRRRLDPLWADAFPRDDMLRLRQGTVILAFVIAADGRVHSVAIRRRSGVARFDQNVRAALAGVQLPPIPRELNRAELRVTAPFEFRNPIVR